MRKFLSVLFAVVLLLSMCTVAYADDGTHVDVGSGEDYNGEISVYCHTYSSYDITIPYELDVSSQADITIRNANIEEGYHLEVYATNLDENGLISVYTMTPGGAEVEGKLFLYAEGTLVTSESNLLCTFTSSELLNPRAAHYIYTFPSSDDVQRAGVYRGTLCIRVACVPNY